MSSARDVSLVRCSFLLPAITAQLQLRTRTVKWQDRVDGNTASESEIVADFVSPGDLSVGWDAIHSLAGAWTGTSIRARQAEIVYFYSCMRHQDAADGSCVREAIT
jgi:hypothetical protein